MKIAFVNFKGIDIHDDCGQYVVSSKMNGTTCRSIKLVFTSLLILIAALRCQPCSAKDKKEENKAEAIVATLSGNAVAISTASLEKNTQLVNQYRVQNNAHGYAAEDGNALHDRRTGHEVVLSGRNNGSDGPDRIVDGTGIQTKYGKSAQYNINTAFDKQTGKYRYPGQLLEVPSDQYEEAVRLFRERIEKGDVPGVTDPEMAKQIVKKGYFTYEQAVKVAKAGNLESIKFDVRTGAVSCLYATGLSFVLIFSNDIAGGMDPEKALVHAGKECGLVAGITMGSHVFTSQILRCAKLDRQIKAVEKFSQETIKKLGETNLGQKVIEKVTQTGTTGAKAVIASSERMMTSTVISAAVTTVVVSSVDVVKGVSGKMEWEDVGKNIASNVAGVAGGAGGSIGGAALGTLVCPGVGTAVGTFVGGMAGGAACSFVTHKAADGIIQIFKKEGQKINN